MVHEMKLRNIPFEKIKTKEKTIELRLLDKKRSKIRIGDTIRFSLVENNNESINTKVINLYFADSFCGFQGICGLFLYAGLRFRGLFFCRYMDGGCILCEKWIAGNSGRLFQIPR